MNGDHGPPTRRILIRYGNNIHGFGVERTFRELMNRINEAFRISTYEVKYNDLNRNTVVSVRTEHDYQTACALLEQQPNMVWEVTGQPSLFERLAVNGLAAAVGSIATALVFELYRRR